MKHGSERGGGLGLGFWEQGIKRTVGDLVEVGGKVHAINEACQRQAATEHLMRNAVCQSH